MEKYYYALYDIQLDGFKPTMCDTNILNLIDSTIDWIASIAKEDELEEYSFNGNIEESINIIHDFDYCIFKINKEEYDNIKNSNKSGLFAKVTPIVYYDLNSAIDTIEKLNKHTK